MAEGLVFTAMKTLLKIAVGLFIASLSYGCASQPDTTAELSQVRIESARETRVWLSHHNAQIYRMCLLEGVGVFLDYEHIDLDAGLFTSYILGHDMDITDYDAARQSGRFLADVWFYNNTLEGEFESKWTVRREIEQGVRDAVMEKYNRR
jgi:hypothetical protein